MTSKHIQAEIRTLIIGLLYEDRETALFEL